jgi:hypothetical protein
MEFFCSSIGHGELAQRKLWKLRFPAAFSAILLLTSAACSGTVASGTGSAEDSSEGGNSAGAAGSSNQNQGGAGGITNIGVMPPPSPDELIWPASFANNRSLLRRLSRDELVVSISTLTGSAPLRVDLPEEQHRSHSALLLSGSSFIDSELSKLRLVLGNFSTKVAPAVFTKTACTATGTAQQDCLVAWAKGFAEAAFRRPLKAEETPRFTAFFTLAGTNKDDDIGSVDAALKAVLFSPSFLYRAEIGTPVANRPRLRALTNPELATRLSYLATLGPVDRDLGDSAKSGKLAQGDERNRQFTRLLGTAAGKKAIGTFVLEWLGANEPKLHLKSAKYLAGLAADAEDSLRASADSAITKAFEATGDASYGALLTTTSYVSDAAIKKVSDPAGTGNTSTGDSADTKRMGLMMHPHVLSAHTKEDGASPFQLGSFMREVFLCEEVPPPDPKFLNQARNDVPAGATMRESLEYRTSPPVCAACHSLFAPIGYAFLPMDPVGRWQKVDTTGKPWNLAGQIETASGSALKFTSPSDLMQRLAESKQAQGCFAQAAVQWAFGRKLVDEDGDLIKRLNELVKRNGASVREVFATIVTSPEFTTSIAAE